jgi:hypothetical protein
LLAVGVPTAAAIVWGLFAAPRATRRLDPTFRIPLELSVFGLACFGLATAGKPTAAWTLGVIITVNAVLLTMFHQWVE